MQFKKCFTVEQVVFILLLIQPIFLSNAIPSGGNGGSDQPSGGTEIDLLASPSDDLKSTKVAPVQNLSFVEEVQRETGCRKNIASESQLVLVLNVIDLMYSPESLQVAGSTSLTNSVPDSSSANILNSMNTALNSAVQAGTGKNTNFSLKVLENFPEPLLKEFVRVQYTTAFRRCVEQLSDEELLYLVGITKNGPNADDVLRIINVVTKGKEEDALQILTTTLINTIPTLIRLLPITGFKKNVTKFSELKSVNDQLPLHQGSISEIIESKVKVTPVASNNWWLLKTCWNSGCSIAKYFARCLKKTQRLVRTVSSSLLGSAKKETKSLSDAQTEGDVSTGTVATAPMVTTTEPVVTKTATDDAALENIINRRAKKGSDGNERSLSFDATWKVFLQTIQLVLFGLVNAPVEEITMQKLTSLQGVRKTLAMFVLKMLVADKISEEFGNIVSALDKPKLKIVAAQFTSTTLKTLDKLESIYKLLYSLPDIMTNLRKNIPANLLLKLTFDKLVKRDTTATTNTQSTKPEDESEPDEHDSSEMRELLEEGVGEIFDHVISTVTEKVFS